MSPSRERWGGRFFLDIGRALYVGKSERATRHAHHAIQICISLERRFRIRSGSGGPWQYHTGAIVSPDAPHELAGDAGGIALLYVEPEGEDGRRLKVLTRGTAIVALEAATVRSLRALLLPLAATNAAPSRDLFQRLLACLGAAVGSDGVLDPRIARALSLLRANTADAPPSVWMATTVGLSTGRFRHLFLANIGISYRRYQLWLRLQAAVDEALRGASLTTAAHAAGFADSAHLTRTFRRMFGITPSALPMLTRLA